MDYKNGYHKDHAVIKLFWKVFYDLPLEGKKKFLGKVKHAHKYKSDNANGEVCSYTCVCVCV